ncbi:MAG: 2-oxoacid:acceptor oxidoreductase subunit alpha [Vampirovibrionales bacterium]
MKMEIVNQFSWMIGGPQGTGVDSSANLFLRSCAVAGLYAYGKREYHSNIMGEHSYFNVRVSETPVHSHVDPVHLLVTFDDETARIHAKEVVANGYFMYDATKTDPATLDLDPSVKTIALPYNEILEEVAKETGQHINKLQIMKNTIAVAASFAVTQFELEYVERALKGIFTGRKAKLVPLNFQVAKRAYDYVVEQGVVEGFGWRIKPVEGAPPRLIMTGTTACALGKLKAGCKFQTYYPITPASDESVFLEGQSKYGINVVQTEDEIAAMCMAVGGGLTGVRSSTSTSGPGFGLMAEGIGWAAINEVPVVVFNYQRGGPSTGLPTRHEQGDLLFTLNICHGDIPRIVLAPGDMTESFEDAFYAFNFADRYQTPVFVLSDKCIGNNTITVDPFKEDHLKIDRGKLVSDEELAKLAEDESYTGQYPRFANSDDHISPRPVPGQKHGLYWCTGDEHTELGHITEDPEIRIWMHDKRMKKMELAAKEIPQHMQYKLYGPEDADITLVCFGSTKGPIIDALPILHSDGISVNMLQIRLMAPFPTEAVTNILNKAKVKVGVEKNYSGQLAQVVRQQTGIKMDHMVLKWTGRPISETEMVQAVRDISKQKSEKVVLTYGE